MDALHRLLITVELSDNQNKWLTNSSNLSDALFIASLWIENDEYDEEIASLAVRITTAAAWLGFPETWDESVIDAVLSDYLPKDDHAYIDILKEHIQLQMILERNDKPTLSLAKQFYAAVFNFFSEGWELNILEPIDSKMVHDIGDGENHIFKKGWSNGKLI